MANKIKDSNITPGTIAADKLAGGIANSQLAGSIANDKLANSSITVNGTSIALGASGDIVAGTDWQAVKTANYTAVAGQGIFANTTGGAFTITLPASPTLGDEVTIVDYAGTFASNNLTVARNGSKIDTAEADTTLDVNKTTVRFVFTDSTQGWKAVFDDTPDYSPQYVTATGGTVSTSGNYKIHTFNSSSNFVVSNAGNSAGSSKVSYLVIAGGSGGANQGGGGGAGGFREGRDSPKDSYTASPLAASDSGLSVTTQTYPVTVGAGGAGAAGPNSYLAQAGSNSVFSTITSAAGGRGANLDASPRGNPTWHAGGSGGGGAGGYSPVTPTPAATIAGGLGNTPPVSPSQGNNGGAGHPGGGSYVHASGGGGGAGGVGGDYVGAITAGAGGNGASSEISGSAVTRAGGGGGGANNPGGSGGAAGPGGGSAGTAGNVSASNATANTGGGGGAVGNDPNSAGSGGSGVVIIRYKYQN